MKRFFASEAGVVAIIFALCLPMIVAAAGMGMDLAQAYLVRQRLGNALDAATLAGAASGDDEAEIESRVQQYFNANYPADRIGTPYNLDVEVEGDNVIVSADADFDTTFMRIFGEDKITIHRSTTVTREVRGLEVAMVLDNTGSMATNNNIASVRTAATSFVNILFDATDDPTSIKIGMVPYSSSVRVGCYGRGQGYNPLTGACSGTYNGGATFITLPSGVSYTTNRSSSSNWYGCVIDHHGSGYNASATHVSGSSGQLWLNSGTACTTSANCSGHGWNPTRGDNDPYPDDVPDDYSGPWDIYMYGTLRATTVTTPNPCGGWRQPACTGSTTTYSFTRDSLPNRYCPYANLIPLTSDKTLLLNNINTMQADGSTLSNTGLAWGYRLLSPEQPFTEGVDWDDEDWRKAVLIMTDGETSMGGNYTSYWITSQNNIDNATLDDRLSDICDMLKDKGVTVYTVTFAAGVPEATKAAYKACATSEAYYFDAPSQSSLVDAFEEIARQLANLHISH